MPLVKGYRFAQRTEEERINIVKRVESGESLDDIAADYGVHKQSIYNYTRSKWFQRIKNQLQRNNK